MFRIRKQILCAIKSQVSAAHKKHNSNVYKTFLKHLLYAPKPEPEPSYHKEIRGYDILTATERDKDTILDLLRRTFFIDEPVLAAAGLSGKVPPELEEYIVNSLREGTSLMAVAGNPDKPIAVVINATLCPDECNLLEEIAATCSCKKLAKLVNFWSFIDKDADLWSTYNVSHIWEVRVLATEKAFRGQGIAGVLTHKSVHMARSMNYPLMRIDCTSSYSARVAESLNMHCVYSLDHNDYLDEEHKPVFSISPPHTSVKMFVQELHSL